MLTVHGHEELGLGEGEHQLLVFLEAMAGHMNALALAVDNLGTEHHQLVDRVHHRDGVAGDRAGRKDDRVRGLHPHLRVLTPGNSAQSCQGFTLAAGHQQQGFTIRNIVDLLDRHKQFIWRAHVAQFAGLGDHVEHRATQQTHLAAVLQGQLQDHRHPVDRAGEGGDDHPAFGSGHVAIEIGEHRPLRGTEARHFRIGGIAEQAQHALFPVMGEAGHVEMLAIDRGVIELEIAREDDGSHRGLDGQRVAVRHRVGVADEFHREVLAHLHHVAGTDGLQRGAVGDAGLLHLSGEHRQGQTGPIDHRDVEVLEVV